MSAAVASEENKQPVQPEQQPQKQSVQQQQQQQETTSGDLTESQLRNLRGQIHQSLLRHDVYGPIRHILSQSAIDPSSGSFQVPTSPSDVLETLRQRGVVQQIAASLVGGNSNNNINSKGGRYFSESNDNNNNNMGSSTLHPLQVNRVSSVDVKSVLQTRGAQRLLLIRLLGGRAFIDNIIAADQQQRGNSTATAGSSMIVHIHFGPHRFRSQPRPLDVDPDFDDEFLAEINAGAKMDIAELNYPLRIMVTRESPFLAKSVFVGENTIDWRRVLKTGSLSVAVELNSNGSYLESSGGAGGGVPAGLLELQLELMPDVRVYSEDELQLRAEQEKNSVVAADREMLLYARRWWSEYHALSPKFAARKVKVFAHSHAGGRTLPVTHFVHRIAPDRSIEGPEDAARFVSLFQLEKPPTLSGASDFIAMGGHNSEAYNNNNTSSSSDSSWCDLMRFLTTRRGDKPAFAVLLCSLFLGLGLDAYCVIGASNQNPSDVGVAVITLASSSSNRFPVCTMWDPVLGTRRDIVVVENNNNASSVSQTMSQQFAPFCLSTIGCVFNSSDYFANIQLDDSIFQCDFNFDDEGKWKRMNPVKLHIVARPQVAPPLWIPLDTRGIEQEFERRFQRALINHREQRCVTNDHKQDGLSSASNTNNNNTIFDSQLSAVFAQALSKSEVRRRCGEQQSNNSNNSGNELFQQCVRGFVEGHTFKGLPLCMPHLDANKALQAALQVPVGKTVIECPFEGAQHAVRAKVYLFPEGIVACWLMIGVKYKTL